VSNAGRSSWRRYSNLQKAVSCRFGTRSPTWTFINLDSWNFLPLFTLSTHWCCSWVGCFSSSQFKQVVTWKQFEQIFLLKVLAQEQQRFCITISIKLGTFLLLYWCSNYLPYTQDQSALKYHQSHQRLTQNLIPQILLKFYYVSYQKDCQYTSSMLKGVHHSKEANTVDVPLTYMRASPSLKQIVLEVFQVIWNRVTLYLVVRIL